MDKLVSVVGSRCSSARLSGVRSRSFYGLDGVDKDGS